MARRRLVEQVFALTPDHTGVLVVSHWAGFSGDRRALTAYVGRSGGQARRLGPRFMPSEVMQREMAEARETAGDRALTEEQARAELAARGIEPETCAGGPGAGDCLETLPVGAFWCRYCGRAVRQVANGMVSGAYRRGAPIHIRTSDAT
jgi:hypothetical protein